MGITLQQDWMRTLPGGKPISALGFGCASVWAKPRFAEADADAIMASAIEGGINHFDTSPSYGAGVGETRLSKFLKGRDTDSLVISTKVGSNLVDGQTFRSFAIKDMERSFDESMLRLGIEQIDILYLHGPRQIDLTDDVFSFFDRLKAAGRIKYSGVNSFDASVLDHVGVTPIDAVMLQYNAADQRLAPQIDLLNAASKDHHFWNCSWACASSAFDICPARLGIGLVSDEDATLRSDGCISRQKANFHPTKYRQACNRGGHPICDGSSRDHQQPVRHLTRRTYGI